MSTYKIGRNDACPCGSGRKYKHCCLNRPIQKQSDLILQKSCDDEDSVFSPEEPSDYGEPKLESSYLQQQPFKHISSPRLLYSMLLMPNIEKIAAEFTNRILNRGRCEAQQIYECQTIEELLQIMASTPDPLNHNLLVAKLLAKRDISVPAILDAFRNSVNATFLELGVRIIYWSGVDCTNTVVELIRNGPRRAYMVSLLCMVLGMMHRNEYAKLLWDYYHFLKERFPDESYSDGPLIGLLELLPENK